MKKRISLRYQQNKIERIERLQSAVATLENYKNFFLSKGELVQEGCWVARYRVRQPKQVYWYYKLHASLPTFPTTTEPKKLTKYKHLGKAGSQAHVDAVMGVVRRTIVEEIQKTIDSLKNSLLDISFDSEQKDK
ncbi:MAG: transposase [Symploca sp. SIO1C4]|uniref:Transposase n=1 Tax=Symploca sp. SIO1C4 TaxID=2607765 RepID=A0A6B3N6Z6_9CYAN|nr:transposase [Symploca sp. SIO1C4]